MKKHYALNAAKSNCSMNVPQEICQSVDVHGAAMNLCLWDPGISSKLKVLTDYTLNTKLLILLGSTSTFGFIANANSVTQVWDPGQQRYELVVRKSKVDDTYSDVNRVFVDSSQGAASRELQPIALLHIICLPKLFQFLQQLLAQLIFVLQAPKRNVWYAAIGGDFSFRKKITEQASALKMTIQGKEAPKAICIARLQGCIRSMEDLIGLELRNFTPLAELKGLIGAQGDKIIVCPPTFSLYEVVALQTCQNDHGSLYVIESELELVKVASIVVAYVVHKAILSESKSFSVLASCGKFKTMMRLMCYVAHLGGHRRVEECTIAALYTHSSLERFNIILSVWLHSNLEGKVLIGEGSIVMNGPKSVMVKQSNITLSGYVWDTG